MSDATGIQWTDATWNPIRGCSKVSAGCKHCYAETMAARFAGAGQPYEGTIKDGRWNGEIRLVPEHLADPLRWQRPRRVFVNSMSDLFHENVPDDYIAAVFGVMAAAPRHTFQVLTKRPERALRWFNEWLPKQGAAVETCLEAAAQEDGDGDGDGYAFVPDAWPLPNVWLGVSVEDQRAADERIPLLLQIPAAVRFLSCEPLIGPVKLPPLGAGAGIDWVIVGGESGPKARPMSMDWLREFVIDCAKYDCACFVKQFGEAPYEGLGDFLRLKDRKGGDPAEWPESLRVREFPVPHAP